MALFIPVFGSYRYGIHPPKLSGLKARVRTNTE